MPISLTAKLHLTLLSISLSPFLSSSHEPPLQETNPLFGGVSDPGSAANDPFNTWGIGSASSVEPFMPFMPPISEATCKQFISTFTSVETMPFQKYRTLELCVLQSIKDQFAKQERNSTSLHGAAVFLGQTPPLRTTSERLNISVRNLMVGEIGIISQEKGFFVSTSFDLVWSDPRLKWSAETWKLKQLQLQQLTNDVVWLPELGNEADIERTNSMPYMSSMTWTSYSEINVTSDGIVTARYGPATVFENTNCFHNLEDFPNDQFSCCTNMISKSYQRQIQFSVAKDLIRDRIPSKTATNEWSIKSISLQPADRGNIAGQMLQFCVTGTREQRALRVELTIPMAIAAIVCLIAPLAPQIKLQLLIKLFALLLQFLCFEFLFENRPELALATSVPRLHRFYEFTIAVTITSLVITFFVLFLLNCNQSRIHPPRSLMNFARSVNTIPLCLRPEANKDVGAAATTGHAGGADDATNSWAMAAIAVNNALSLGLIVVYIIGIIVIVA